MSRPYTLEQECERYGLPVSFDVLMHHVYNNHAATVGALKHCIGTLEERLEGPPPASCDSCGERAWCRLTPWTRAFLCRSCEDAVVLALAKSAGVGRS